MQHRHESGEDGDDEAHEEINYARLSRAQRRKKERLDFLRPLQPSRFTSRRVPPYLYFIVKKSDWLSGASDFYHDKAGTGILLCDLDRLDSLVAREHFFNEYKAATEEADQGSFVWKSVRVVLSKVSSVLMSNTGSSASARAEKYEELNSGDETHPFLDTSRRRERERLSGVHTNIHAWEPDVLTDDDHWLIVAHANALDRSGDLFWNAGETRDYPCLVRPLSYRDDAWAQFQLRFDVRNLVVALPDECDIEYETQIATALVKEAHNRNK